MWDKDERQRLEKLFWDNPERYPERPGYEYYIVQLDSNGNKVRNTGGHIRVTNGHMDIVQLPAGAQQKWLCWKLKRKE